MIYRPVPEDEGGGWLVLSLMSADEYQDVTELQELLTEAPAARSLLEAALAGVVSEKLRVKPRSIVDMQWTGDVVVGNSYLSPSGIPTRPKPGGLPRARLTRRADRHPTEPKAAPSAGQ